jgi:hypothetical protein
MEWSPIKLSLILFFPERPYFELKARFNQTLDDQKRQVQLIEETIVMTKQGVNLNNPASGECSKKLDRSICKRFSFLCHRR